MFLKLTNCSNASVVVNTDKVQYAEPVEVSNKPATKIYLDGSDDNSIVVTESIDEITKKVEEK